ncbi:MAG: hypothetical protein AB7I32_03495 [Gammaproteobacteria bacterium]
MHLHSRRALAALALAGCCTSAQANNYVEFAWTGNTLSHFLAEHEDTGIGIPLIEPYAIRIVGDVAHTADIGLVSQSLVTLADGRLDLTAAGYTNRPEGLFVVDEVGSGPVFIVAVPGLAAAPVFSNEGMLIVTEDSSLQINGVKLVNLNGGTIEMRAGSSTPSLYADLRQGSQVTGAGLLQMHGLLSGEIHSGSSLSLANGTTVASDAVIDGVWSWQSFSRLEGTLTNRGTVTPHQHILAADKLGTLAAGGRFVNEGYLSGEIGLVANIGDPARVTEFVNRGFASVPSLVTSGAAPVRFVNEGTLALRGSLFADNLQFENSGRVELAAGVTATLAGRSAARPLRRMVFRDGAVISGLGTASLTGEAEFFGTTTVTGNQLALRGTLYHGNGANLAGALRWSDGDFTGAWTNSATLTATGRSSGPSIGIRDVFDNLGRVVWSSDLYLREGAVLVNHGTLGTPATSVGGGMFGTTGGAVETVMNFGRLLEEGGGRTRFVGIDFQNLGVIELRDGGEIDFASATLSNLGSIIGNGTLRVGPGFVNHGTIAPGLSPGQLTINGHFANGDDGVLEMELASDTVFDRLVVTRTATLGGTLRLKLLDGYVPEVGDSFRLFGFDALEGAFAHILLDGYDADFELDVGRSFLALSVVSISPAPVPLPPSLALFAGAMALLARYRRRRE